jgi:outer membrane protein OmpA-like peptidoglycan-associated protein
VRRLLASLLATMVASPANAQAPGDTVRFISCPIYRDVDAGRKSGCWLADERESGRRFDIGNAPTKPDWNHEVLVEGKISSAPDACGGVVLEPVRVSVLPGACTRQMLPPEGFKGRAFVLPERNVRPVAVPRPAPQPPFTERSFFLLYDFNRDFLVYQLDDYLLDQAITYIRGAAPKRILVTGYAATTLAKVSGRSITEDVTIAKSRAQSVTEALVRLGIDPKIIETKWQGAANPADAPGADGLGEASRRRVEIRVVPK